MTEREYKRRVQEDLDTVRNMPREYRSAMVRAINNALVEFKRNHKVPKELCPIVCVHDGNLAVYTLPEADAWSKTHAPAVVRTAKSFMHINPLSTWQTVRDIGRAGKVLGAKVTCNDRGVRNSAIVVEGPDASLEALIKLMQQELGCSEDH